MIKIEDLVQLPTPLQKWSHPLFIEKSVNVYVKRDDLSHPILSGNKFRKLKYNLRAAKSKGFESLLSFGGAFSNHLYAMAGVCKYSDFKVKMLIRGDELNPDSSSTLAFANECGVELIFVDRKSYRDKADLVQKYGSDSFIIPEGGSNKNALLGVSELVDEIMVDIEPNYIIAAMGTGGTVAGLLSNEIYDGKIIGVSSLKGGSFLKGEVDLLLDKSSDFDLWVDYSFGGYAKHTDELLRFIANIEQEYEFPLEHVYTAKLFFAVLDKVKNDYFPIDSQIVIYHSGGLQGKIKV
ncbi:1-aminocyclopropane-1-carboxylate deaminase [Spirosomataceae bacterium TFI 002]|nr:1-aminocyclopropane-1-carboxylate deaminase [Spirosomataceae bacterium TFI 002]